MILCYILLAREISEMVSQGTPNALVGVRFLHLPQKISFMSFFMEESKTGARRREAGSSKFSAENYA